MKPKSLIGLLRNTHWEKSLAESTAPFRYVVTTTGVGLYQLTYSSMKTRETIWNWKENLIQSCKFMAENYKNSCEHLDGQNQADPALFVYRPGQYYGGTFGFPLTLHVMRRLNALNRFNGGPDDRYYWWNDTQANPSLMTLVNITGGTVNSTNPESVLVPLEFQSVQHNATNPTTAHLTTYDWTSMQSTTAQHPSFFWSVTNAVVPANTYGMFTKMPNPMTRFGCAWLFIMQPIQAVVITLRAPGSVTPTLPTLTLGFAPRLEDG